MLLHNGRMISVVLLLLWQIKWMKSWRELSAGRAAMRGPGKTRYTQLMSAGTVFNKIMLPVQTGRCWRRTSPAHSKPQWKRSCTSPKGNGQWSCCGSDPNSCGFLQITCICVKGWQKAMDRSGWGWWVLQMFTASQLLLMSSHRNVNKDLFIYLLSSAERWKRSDNVNKYLRHQWMNLNKTCRFIFFK